MFDIREFEKKVFRLIDDGEKILDKCRELYFKDTLYYQNKYDELNTLALEQPQQFKDWCNDQYTNLNNLNLANYDTPKVNALIDLRIRRVVRHFNNINENYLGTLVNIYSNLIVDILHDFERAERKSEN